MRAVVKVLLLSLLGISEAIAKRSAAGLAGGEAPTSRHKKELSFEPWAEMLEEEGRKAHSTMSAWLQDFFAKTLEGDLHPRPPLVPKIKPRGVVLPPRKVASYNESLFDSHVWTRWNLSQTCADFLEDVPRTYRRRHLIVAPVGSAFDASKWMNHPNHSTYDIIALYYGNAVDFSCPLCKYVINLKGSKWQLLNSFIRQNQSLWNTLATEYSIVMVADDDLEFDTCMLNRAFELFSSYRLLLAQPSLCRTRYRSSYWAYLYQNPGSILRYITFVEIMAPMFDMGFFQGLVGPSLWNAYAGWGLDFTWPFLLRYPKRHIAVIDEVCMTHAAPIGGKTGEGDLYSVPVPYSQQEEETRRVGEFGYYQSRVEAMGLPYRNMETLGEVQITYSEKEQLLESMGPSAALEDFLPFSGDGGGGGALVSTAEAVTIAFVGLVILGIMLVRRQQREQRKIAAGIGNHRSKMMVSHKMHDTVRDV